ncbi:MAG: ATP-binding protein [Bacteroidia bacterium]|nr:MAG: ATP-binding protein [Bacteroidia bacterium]
MYLQSFTFRENAGQNIEWLIENVSLGEINLVVGKNSSGKTRTLNALSDLVSMLRGNGTSASGPVRYELLFRNSENLMRYELEYNLETIKVERLYVGEELVLERGEGGSGIVKYEATSGSIFLEFEIPHDQLACYAKRDRLQHPFIEIIHGWAISLRRFDFSGDMGKTHYVLKSSFETKEMDWSITNNSLVPLITLAEEEYPQFRELILKDMQKIGYDLEDFGIIHFSERFSHTSQDRFAVFTTERGLEKQVTQRDMSQGMFRAFSVLVQVNYYILSGQKGLVIIDDIGEGLDFNRAKQLVQVLIVKAKESTMQLIMSTNDSFIMNAVDIENWAVIMREGHKISLYNYANSKEIFEEFKFTGLNNFDFYASEFFKSGFSEEEDSGPETEED